MKRPNIYARNGFLHRFALLLGTIRFCALSAFPDVAEKGVYITAGIGGRWTPNGGRPVCFRPAGWSVRQEGVTPDGGFRVSLTVGRPRVQPSWTRYCYRGESLL